MHQFFMLVTIKCKTRVNVVVIPSFIMDKIFYASTTSAGTPSTLYRLRAMSKLIDLPTTCELPLVSV